jgi:leader peptidase (prepilin peptidase)/N-methyltransferase
VTAQLIAGASLTGVVLGGLLDPLGQRLAERSLRDQLRGNQATPSPSAQGSVGDPELSSPGDMEVGEIEVGDMEAGDMESGDMEQPPHLLPAGVSPVRTVGAALVTGALVAGGANQFGAHLVVVPFAVFFSALVVVSTTDLSHGLIPRRLVYPALATVAALFVVIAGVDGEGHRLWTAGIGAVATFAVLFVIWWLAPRGIGFGDVRLSALIGLATGWIGLLDVYVAVVSGFVVGLLFGIATMGLRGTGRRTRIPFAPALAAGAIVAVFWGAPIVQAVFHRTI